MSLIANRTPADHKVHTPPGSTVGTYLAVRLVNAVDKSVQSCPEGGLPGGGGTQGGEGGSSWSTSTTWSCVYACVGGGGVS